MKRSDITPAIVRELLRYEPDTGKLFWRERAEKWFRGVGGGYTAKRAAAGWNAKYANREAIHTESGDGYRVGRVFDLLYRAHRVAWAIETGRWPDHQIDHLNHIRNDNRIKNLRDATHAENGRNQKIRSNSTSGVLGVTWYEPRCKWHARIMFNGRKIHLGYFIDKVDAIAARKSAEAEYGFHANHGRRE